MSIQLQTKGMNASKKYLSSLIEELDENVQDAMLKVINQIIADARSNLQNNANINSGTLLASIRILEEGKNYYLIGTDIEYAEYIEYGRGPINAKPGKTLHWIDKKTGKDVFAKHADAYPAHPFLEPAVIVNTRKLSDILAENIAEVGLPIGSVDQ